MENNKNPSSISAKRIGQIRTIIENTEQHILDQMISNVGDSTRAIIHGAFSQNDKKNKLQKKQLRSFINSYIASVSSSEFFDLINVVEYYEGKYERASGDIEDDGIEIENELIPLNKRIEKLCINGTILPKTTNNKEFRTEMNGLVERLRNNIEKEALKKGFTLGYLDSDILLDIVREGGENRYDVTIGEEMNGYISSANFTLSLNELHEIEEGKDYDGISYNEDYNDNIKFEIKCNREGNKGVGKEDLKEFFKSQGYHSDGDNISFFQNDHIEIKGYIFTSKSSGVGNESYKLEFYAKKKKDRLTSKQFLDLSIGKLAFTVEEVINNIYEEFGPPDQAHFFELEKLFQDMMTGGSMYSNSEEDDDGLGVQGKEKTTNTKKEAKIESNKKKKYPEIILDKSIKKEFNTLEDQFNNEQHYIDYGVKIPKGIVLHGPAGTGKTLFAKHISENVDAEFVVISVSDILNKWVGDNEKNMKKVFTNARAKAKNNKKVIIFFDEADALFEKRGDQKTHKEGLISILLQEMDGINEDSLKNIFIFFTTNRLNAIDGPVLSRFNKKIEIGLPNFENRVKLFKLYISEKMEESKHNIFKELDYELLAKSTKGKSGRFINQLINNTVLEFAHSRVNNPRSKLVTTKDIINNIKLVEQEEKKKQKIGFVS